MTSKTKPVSVALSVLFITGAVILVMFAPMVIGSAWIIAWCACWSTLDYLQERNK